MSELEALKRELEERKEFIKILEGTLSPEEWADYQMMLALTGNE